MLVVSVIFNIIAAWALIVAGAILVRDLSDDELRARLEVIEQKSQHLEQLRRQLTAPPPKPCAANDLNCITKGE